MKLGPVTGRLTGRLWPLALAVAGVAYPLMVYAALPHVPAKILLVPLLALLAVRILGTADLGGRGATLALLVAGGVLMALAMVDSDLAVRAYPVAMSLAAAAAFGVSLGGGPSLIERIARRQTPDLPASGVRYTRRVTMAWCGFLIANAVVSAGITAFGSLEQWTLWNGLLFYLLAGALLGGEWLVRRAVQGRAA